ncbi:ketopantoate reductase family protein [Bacillus horti]|uniref:2-dehydropantoate 2-reductase n=1 Tax=Caldalkalibacillus horti TaxID=77523 RepID=A0ABT9VUE6_9BACI|nr:2-dehydropantoate 2-reductase [Bacillus horti]MDQ0164594.1 2-dehydropantoate 2-reductase [Bacillus horti]
MRILIIGAGALGLLFGAYLSKENDVTFITRRKQQAEQIREYGCRLVTLAAEDIRYSPEAFTWEDHKEYDEYDLILVTIKQYHLANVLEEMKARISHRVSLLFILNGLGHNEAIAEKLPHIHVFLGSTQFGALKESDTVVLERGVGSLTIGQLSSQDKERDNDKQLYPSSSNGIELLMTSMQRGGIDIKINHNIEAILLHKCMINACINPLTALFKVTNGDLLTNMGLHQMQRKVFEEVIQVVQKANPSFLHENNNERDLWEEIKDVCRNTSRNKSSMLQDVENQRLTEIDAITGYFLHLAMQHEISVPYHDFLYHAIHIQESLYS